ncbi:MAG: YidC/Oxa1 family membrane protein insertase [Clostridiales bacterium]|nr:YidC/Oxa1 family membrane protein insertase [Clostridiales bacterium]
MICVSSFITFLTNVIPDEPGFIVGPISWVLGVILNFVFNVVYFITENFSLGITIIVVTIIARVLMLPLSFKQQKSMVVMRKIQPEIKKIQDKYKDDMADPEVKRKMNTEMQKLYSQNNYNPLSGCLPLLIQLPIFIALYYIMQNSYAFIDTINDSYMEISNVIVQEVSEDKESGSKLLEQREEVLKIKQKNEGERSDGEKELISNYDSNKFIFWYEFSKNDIYPMIPEDMKNPEPDSGDEEFNTLKPEHMVKAFDKLSSSQWKKINDVFKNDKIEENLIKKENIEYFGPGINLTEVAGIGFPGVIITLLSGITTFLSSWLMTRKNKDMGGAAASQQKIMMITMPLIMAWITSGLPCGVGLYWITSNIFMIAQQQILNKYYENKLSLEEDKLNKVIDENPKSKNGKNRKSKR